MYRQYKKLLAIGPIPPPINGMSKAFGLVVSRLKEKGWSIEVVNVADDTKRRRSAFTVGRAVAVTRLLWAGWAKLGWCDVLYVAISQSRLGFLKDAALLAPAALLRKPIVVHLHGGNFRNFYDQQPRFAREIIRRLLGMIDKIVVLCPEMRADFQMVADWEKKTVAIANASEVPVSVPREAPKGKFRILYLSNMLVEKGFLDVLQGGAELAKRLPEWEIRIDFAGEFQLGQDGYPNLSELQREFEVRVSSLPGNARAEWHGVVDGKKKLSLLQNSHVFVLPTYINEGQPISILEALASGLPVVSTPQRGIRTSLPSSFEILLVSPQSPNAIADRLIRLATDPEWYRQLSLDALKKAKDYEPAAHISALHGVLSEACSPPRQQGA